MTEGSGLRRHVPLRSATALVVANIIGAGIFTTTGFQASALGHPGYILLLWVVGGVLAFSGAVCYAELGAAFPKTGGEYVYLRETYGPLFGFMSAFVSLLAGFSAPIAAACKGFIGYLAHFFPILMSEGEATGFVAIEDLAAIGVVWILVAIHARHVRMGFGFNDLITLFKVVGIVGILVLAAAIGRGSTENFTSVSPAFLSMSTSGVASAFATSLVFVMFCYSGWNASAYIASEIKDPQRHLPRSLFFGTAIVIVLYLGLNLVYFYGAGVEELAGQAQVGLVASKNLFGSFGVALVTVVLCVSIFASASAMTIAGPRVYYALGKDQPRIRGLGKVSAATGAPTRSLLLQGVVTTVIILSGRIDQIQLYAGFTLSLFTSLAVSCVLVLRIRRPGLERPFRAWGYPLTPLLYLAVSAWMMVFAVRGRPVESVVGLLTVLAGGLIFAGLVRLDRSGSDPNKSE